MTSSWTETISCPHMISPSPWLFQLGLMALLHHSLKENIHTHKSTRHFLIQGHRKWHFNVLFCHHQRALRESLLLYFCSGTAVKLCWWLKNRERETEEAERKLFFRFRLLRGTVKGRCGYERWGTKELTQNTGTIKRMYKVKNIKTCRWLLHEWCLEAKFGDTWVAQ